MNRHEVSRVRSTGVRTIGAIVAAVMLLAAVSIAAASGTSPGPVIAYTRFHTLTNIGIYVTGPGGSHEVGHGQDPSVAPDGQMVSGSGLGNRGPGLTLYDTAGRRLRSFFDGRIVTPLAWSRDSRYLAVLLDTAGRRITGAGLAVIDTRTMTARGVVTGAVRGASFAPSGSDRLVYGDQAPTAPGEDPMINLSVVNPDGSGRTQLTSDGDSFSPLWTAKGIVYDRESRGRPGASPTYQLWRLRDGHSVQLTNRRPPRRGGQLVPVAASASGNRLIADYEGPGGITPLAVQLSPRWVRTLDPGDTTVQGVGISRDGRTLLLERRSSASPGHDGLVQTLPFGGGRPTRIASGDSAAWNG